MIIWTNSSGERHRFIRIQLNVKLLALECKQGFILAFPLLQLTLVVTVVGAHLAAEGLALGTQAFSGHYDEKSVAGCPTHVKATDRLF